MASIIIVVHGQEDARTTVRDTLTAGGHSVVEAAELPVPAGVDADLVLVEFGALEPLGERLAEIKAADGATETRVIVLAAQDQLATAVRALEHGADDCVPLPFVEAELMARVSACLRRPPCKAYTDRVGAGPIELDRGTHRVHVRGQLVEFAPTEFRLMAFFLENQGRVFSRSELLRRAWGRNIKAGPRTVDVHVRRLRQQLEPFGCEAIIQTVRGFGYRLSVEQHDRRRQSGPLTLGESRP